MKSRGEADAVNNRLSFIVSKLCSAHMMIIKSKINYSVSETKVSRGALWCASGYSFGLTKQNIPHSLYPPSEILAVISFTYLYHSHIAKVFFPPDSFEVCRRSLANRSRPLIHPFILVHLFILPLALPPSSLSQLSCSICLSLHLHNNVRQELSRCPGYCPCYEAIHSQRAASAVRGNL